MPVFNHTLNIVLVGTGGAWLLLGLIATGLLLLGAQEEARQYASCHVCHTMAPQVHKTGSAHDLTMICDQFMLWADAESTEKPNDCGNPCPVSGQLCDELKERPNYVSNRASSGLQCCVSTRALVLCFLLLCHAC